jgi:predicted nucleic acid-binding Zn ribbon protein
LLRAAVQFVEIGDVDQVARAARCALDTCPASGQKVERVLQPFTPRYKGTGFYSTDHRKPKAKEHPKAGGGE